MLEHHVTVVHGCERQFFCGGVTGELCDMAEAGSGDQQGASDRHMVVFLILICVKGGEREAFR